MSLLYHTFVNKSRRKICIFAIRRVRPTNSKYAIAFAMDKKDDGKRIIFHRLLGADEGTCKERSDSKGILQKFRLTSEATE